MARIIVLVVAVIAIAALVFTHAPSENPSASGTATTTPVATVLYACQGGKSLAAAFFAGESKPAVGSSTPPTPGGSVALSLSDGRQLNLAQTISADGVRFANADESLVFWVKGNGALVLEHSKDQTYLGCVAVAPEQGNLTEIYANGNNGFSIRTPKGFAVNQAYQYQLAPKKSIAGIKFTISTSSAQGTNLGKDTYLSVESIPNTEQCSASLFLPQTKPILAQEGSMTYSIATSTGAGAGNRYDEIVYALPGSNPCIGVRYWIHYSAIENYPKGTVTEFDRQALLAQFDAIRRSLLVIQ